MAINESYAPSEVGRGNRTGDSGWAAADHHQIIVFGFHLSDRFCLPGSPLIENDADRYGLQVFAMRVVEGIEHPMIDSVSARDFGVSATIVASLLNQRSKS